MRFTSILTLIAGAAACSSPGAVTPAPSPSPIPVAGSARPAPLPADRRPVFPPIPRVAGPLAIRIVYPAANALVAARDSNFLLGSVGTGDATLTINGVPVRVEPNGAFVAWLPVPPADAAVYHITASTATDTQRVEHPIRFSTPATPLPLEGRLVVDSAPSSPRAGLALRDEEAVRVSITAPANARVALSTPAGDRLLARNGDVWSTTVPARLLRTRTKLVVSRGGDTVHVPVDRVDAGDALPGVVLGDSLAIARGDSDRVVIGRPVPGETYKWFFLPGTVLKATGRLQGYTRVRLDQALEAWVANADVRMLADSAPTPAIASSGRVRPMPYGADVIVPLSRRPAYLVEERAGGIVLTLYGVQGSGDRTRYPGTDDFIRTIEWRQESTDRAVYTIRLSRPVFGYHVVWERNALVLRLRRAPTINAARPLEGRLIVVDPGHPPAGTTGPTGLYEGDAVLEVGKTLAEMLAERGARVVMTRTTRDTVALADRPIIARRANAEALVSIHLNALPDGANPLTAQGTETYFFHPHSETLARTIHIGMLRSLGLPDRGVFTRDLAMARPTWMPAVLAEGAYLILADAEAGMRKAEVQRAYAAGLLEGLEVFFRSLAQ